jgi:hypothetical protein
VWGGEGEGLGTLGWNLDVGNSFFLLARSPQPQVAGAMYKASKVDAELAGTVTLRFVVQVRVDSVESAAQCAPWAFCSLAGCGTLETLVAPVVGPLTDRPTVGPLTGPLWRHWGKFGLCRAALLLWH